MANKTPEERSEMVEKAQVKAKKGYRSSKKPRQNVSKEELEIITDTLVALKVIGGYSNSQCAAIVNLSKGQVTQLTKTDRFQKRVETVRKSLPQAALNLGQAFLVESVMAVMHVMRTEKRNDLVLKAAAEMFDRFGLPKMTRTESTVEIPGSESAGDVGDIPDKLVDKLRASSPEIQESIASLHESFVEGVERILSGGTNGSDD